MGERKSVLLGLCLAALTPSSLASTPDLVAQPAGLDDPRWRESAPREETLAGEGSERLARAQVALNEMSMAALADGLRLVAAQSGASIEATPVALGWPGNWRDFGELVLSVHNPGDEGPVNVVVTVLAARGRLIEPRWLGPGATAEIRVPLGDLALASAARPLYDVGGIRIQLEWTGRAARRSVTLRELRLTGRDGDPPRVLDRFGQRLSTWWPGKIHSDDELRARRDFEALALARLPAPGGRDRFGGLTSGPEFHASGFFRVEQGADRRWWFVTPDGNPFWSLGTTGVRIGNVMDSARAAGREHLFAALPRPGEEAWLAGEYPVTTGTVVLEGNVHFYRWNVLRKYDSIEDWRDRVLWRWERWGLNTIGAWSDEIMLEQRRVPHTRFLRARAEVPGVASVHGFPDVWDTRWEEWVDSEFARETAREHGNPWLVGYFVDNEASWRNMRLLDMPVDTPLRAAWLEFARSRYGTVEAFNAEWGTACGGWSVVQSMESADVPASGPAREAMQAFESVYADRYAGTVRRLLKKHDPDHLYLGCRFVRMPPHAGIVAAVGRHVDVLSVNCYARVPDPDAFRAWHEMSGGRPILIGEFHFPLESPRQFPPLYPTFPAAEREQMLVEFIRVWAEQPWSVGCHWYQHADQPTTGRHSDGENQTVGIVSIVDEPYEHLVRGFRAALSSAARNP